MYQNFSIYVRTKLQFMEKEKRTESMWKQCFQVQCFHVSYTLYLQTCINIDLKTKALFKLYKNI